MDIYKGKIFIEEQAIPASCYHRLIATLQTQSPEVLRLIFLPKQHLTGTFPFAATLGLCYDGLASWIATAKLFRKIPKNGVDDTSE
jgi:hypothetical protein